MNEKEKLLYIYDCDDILNSPPLLDRFCQRVSGIESRALVISSNSQFTYIIVSIIIGTKFENVLSLNCFVHALNQVV